MTVVRGQIDSLKSLKLKLHSKGITRFQSIGEIRKFQVNYKKEKASLKLQAEQEYLSELHALVEERDHISQEYYDLKGSRVVQMVNTIARLKQKYKKISAIPTSNTITETWYWYWLQLLKYRIAHLEHNFDYMIERQCALDIKELEEMNARVAYVEQSKTEGIQARTKLKTRELEHTQKVIKDLQPLIAGAIGEYKVVQELKKREDHCILINDYYRHFAPPIYNNKEHGTIRNVQIDHLLITTAGIFIIETKNWSKASVENRDLRSPIKQIQRSNYALWWSLNKSYDRHYLKLNHHWGERSIPIHNLVIMIHHKPFGKFKHVHIKTLNEVNRFIDSFEQVLTEHELNNVAEYLQNIHR